MWPAKDGIASAPSPGPRVAVVGGGIAGLTAATALAERGVRVDLLERDGALGGRVSGWPTPLADASTATMSRGFHAFFRQYYNLRHLLRRIDPELSMLRPLADYPLQRGKARDSFRRVPRTPPWSVLGFVALSPSFTWSGLAGMNPRQALALLDVRVPDVYERLDHISAAEYLDRVRFPEDARHLAFEVFSRSFFADPHQLSAAELVLMFHVYFLGSSEGLLFDVPCEPCPQALWDPLAAYLSKLGTTVETGTRVVAVRPDGSGFRVTRTRADSPSAPRREEPYDGVVLALDTSGLQSVVAASPDLVHADWRARVERLRQAPPFLVSRYWLDRPVHAGRPGFLGTSGYGPVDNISVLDQWEGEAARWAAATGGSVVELHAYAVDPTAERGAVEAAMLRELARVYPECADARVVDVRHEWRDDCPLFPVGGYADRPSVRTGHPRLVLAGDVVRSTLPVALMERAATTGFQAANALLESWGVLGHPLWSVPTQGRYASMRALARLG
ncbi:FAD-dependent oxidoreductase [Actinacidiphila glaucinigra]